MQNESGTRADLKGGTASQDQKSDSHNRIDLAKEALAETIREGGAFAGQGNFNRNKQ